mmetsp:Transcript_20672/g.18318  ORF Transcript_20672/g.18318 Transcript_20672/m.18318 type:complete len:98 (+) Transcript_20672:203-496(+)
MSKDLPKKPKMIKIRKRKVKNKIKVTLKDKPLPNNTRPVIKKSIFSKAKLKQNGLNVKDKKLFRKLKKMIQNRKHSTPFQQNLRTEYPSAFGRKKES